MKRKNIFAWLFMIVCMIMLTASVFPHHHHEHMMLCMQTPAHDCEDDHQQTPATTECQQDCITKFHCCRSHCDFSVDPDFAFETLLYAFHAFFDTLLPDNPDLIRASYTHYLERLHSRLLIDAQSLRAPPTCA